MRFSTYQRLTWSFWVGLCLVGCNRAFGDAVAFFNGSQVATPVSSGTTSDTIASNGYRFTYTRDKLFTGGYGMTVPIGRPVQVAWPNGIHAQAVTAGPNPGKAKITITRVDGEVFDLVSFGAKLLANTAGAGADLEIMPSLDGEDAFNDPVYFNASGYTGSQFYYDTTPNYWGSTALLTGYDKYTIGLYVDFALTSLTLDSAATAEAVPAPSALAILWLFIPWMTLRRLRPAAAW